MAGSLVEQAKQGDPTAIAALINRSMQPKGITAKVLLQDDTLKVMLESPTIPDESRCAAYVFNGIQNLQLTGVGTVYVYGRLIGEKVPAWTQNFRLNNAVHSASHPASENATAATSTSDSRRASNLPPEIQSTRPNIHANDQSLEQNAPTQKMDEEQIAIAIRNMLDDPEIEVNIHIDDQVLSISLSTAKFLEGQALAKQIHSKLNKLYLSPINTAKLFKQNPKNGRSFLIQELNLTTDQTTESTPDLQPQSSSLTEPPNRFKASLIDRQTEPPPKKKENINLIRKRLTAILFLAIAIIVIMRLFSRVFATFFAFGPASGISLLLLLFFLWKAWSALDPIIQWFVRSGD